MSVTEPDAPMLCNEDQYCTLQEAVDLLNRKTPELNIQQRDLFRCAALNLVSLQLHYNANLRLVAGDDLREIGNYLYNGPVEIQDYTLGSERKYSNFETYKVRPLESHRLQPDPHFGISPAIKGAHLAAPCYFATYWYTTEESNDDGGYRIHNGCFVETSDIRFDINDLPKLKDAVINLKRETEERHKKFGRYTLEEAASHISDETKEREDTIQKKLVKAAEIGALLTYEPGSLIKHEGNEVRAYHEEVYWKDLYDWLENNERQLACELHKPNENVYGAHVHTTKEGRLPVATQQNNAILNWLKESKCDPLKLPVPPSGKAGVKKACRDELCRNNKPLFSSRSVFDTAWERLRANDEIKDTQ